MSDVKWTQKDIELAKEWLDMTRWQTVWPKIIAWVWSVEEVRKLKDHNRAVPADLDEEANDYDKYKEIVVRAAEMADLQRDPDAYHQRHERVRELVSEKFGYDLPDKLYLSIMLAEERGAVRPDDDMAEHLYMGQPDQNLGMQFDFQLKDPTLNARLVMFVPKAPPPTKQALAIAEYLESGRTYPFTCW